MITFIRSFFNKKTNHNINKVRSFEAAKYDRLVSDWLSTTEQINDELKNNLPKLRARSREMVKNSALYRRYIFSDLRSVIGPRGIRLQMNIRDDNDKSDNMANDLIEKGWHSWSRKASACQMLTWLDVQNLVRRTMIVDGECFIRKIKGLDGAKYTYALQVIDCEMIPSDMNSETRSGNRILNGIEIDDYGRRIAYYVKDNRYGTPYYSSDKTIRVDASEIMHLYDPEFVGQMRGFPPACASMLQMHHLNKYTEAEVIAARMSACKMGHYENPQTSDPYSLAEDIDGKQLLQDFAPGKKEILPAGWSYKESNPTHPNGNYGEFSKEMKRDIAGGVDMTYNQLANDLEGVNYSSLRSGKLDEHDSYRVKQQRLVEHLCRPTFAGFLPMFLLSGETKLPFAKINKFFSDTWLPRSFPWVDPLKDAQAQILLIDNNLRAPQYVIGEQGEDIQEVYSMIQKANEMKTKYNLEGVNDVTTQEK